MIQVGFDLEIFTLLSSSGNTVTHQEFVAQTGAAPTLLVHLLRSLAAFGLISETAKDTFQANHVTHVFANPHVIGALPHLTEIHGPVANILPEYLRDHKYQDITDFKNLPFQRALKTDLEPFEWLKKDGKQMKALGHVMVLDAVQSWVSSYPVDKEVSDFKAVADSVLLVDIGGGFGQHSVAFKQKFPNIGGRVVVQDVPSTLVHAPAVDGISFEAHNFFTLQPIKGAKFYYLRHIMHDWPDVDCVRILTNIIPAMSSESRILIDDVVLPESKVPWQVAMMDLAMMACLGGIERSRSDWATLLDQAGLKIDHVYQYDDSKFHSIIAAVPQ